MPFDYQPILRGELDLLRPLRAEDHDALCAVAADPLIWEQHPDRSRSEPAGFGKFFRQALDSEGALAAFDAASGAMSAPRGSTAMTATPARRRSAGPSSPDPTGGDATTAR